MQQPVAVLSPTSLLVQDNIMERVVLLFSCLTFAACSNQPRCSPLNDVITHVGQHHGKSGTSLCRVGILGAATSPLAVPSMRFIAHPGQHHEKGGASLFGLMFMMY